MSSGSSESEMAMISSSYSCRIASLRFLVAPGVGIGESSEGGAKAVANAFAERPPGSDWMFSLCVSIMSKLIRSSVVDMMLVVDSPATGRIDP